MPELLETDATEPTTSVAVTAGATPSTPDAARRVTSRALLLGLAGTALIAWLNCWLATKSNVHMLGGIQMPFGALVVLMVFALANRFVKFFSATELLTMYSMMVLGALVSTPGCDNAFMAFGPTLFYFSTPENGWAKLFWKYVPTWFAPGWNGTTYQKDVVDAFYLGNGGKIPWQAWTPMLIGWGVFLVLVYALMFFTALLFRKQWTQREALAFPLVEVPAQMAEVEGSASTAGAAFWSNYAMWAGFGLAFFVHSFKGLNAFFPDMPILSVNQYGFVPFVFTEAPLNAIGPFHASVYLGGIGLAYLLTREVSFSFWFFYAAMMAVLVAAQVLGYPPSAIEKMGVSSQPAFIIHAVTGGWIMFALMLAWTAREHLRNLLRAAFNPQAKIQKRGAYQTDSEDEPFSPRVMVFGWLLTFVALLAWSAFAGINVVVALVFLAMFLVTSLVIARLVVEGGFLFPQPPYFTLEVLTKSFGWHIGASDLTRLAFVQPTILADMRTAVLPAFLNTMKLAEVLRLDRRHLRRLLLGTCAALVVAVAVTAVATLRVLYSQGGLQGYGWFSKDAGQATFSTLSSTIKTPPAVSAQSWIWMAVGALLVYVLIVARSRLLWFPLHPLGFLMAPGYPITQLWFSFFLGWLCKSVVMKYGGNSSYVSLRPFMIGLILGNAVAMVFWTLLAYFITGAPIAYWPA